MADPLLLAHDTNLAAFHGHAPDLEALLAGGHFARVGDEALAECIHGEVWQACWATGPEPGAVSVDVAGKRMPGDRVRINIGRRTRDQAIYQSHREDPENPHIEDPLTEIGVLSYLRRQPDLPYFLVRMMGLFSEGPHIWLLTEFVTGGELFGRVVAGEVPNDEGTVRQIMWQMLQGVRYLHSHHIGHRDISLENTLISFEPDITIRIMDFGQAVETERDGVPLRYFMQAGKPYYKSPEMIMPRPAMTVRIDVPAGATPGQIVYLRLAPPRHGYITEVLIPPEAEWNGRSCDASLMGYRADLADMFATGVAMFILAFTAPPWARAALNDQSFAWIYGQGPGGIPALLRHWGRPSLSDNAMDLMCSLMNVRNCAARPSAQEALAHPWLADLAAEVVPLHPPLPAGHPANFFPPAAP